MGEIFEAVDLSLGRVVAIKRLRSDRLDPTLPGWAAWNARFRREARLLAAINHPNIATIHTIVEYGGVLHLVMERVDGHSLREVLKPGPLEPELALEIARQVATGLMAAHEAGVIHRDVKPDNIRINSRSVVKILDFGLARERDDEETLPVADLREVSVGADSPHTRVGVFLGTPGYASPEQVLGEAVDQRTDVFSFGCTLFEMLCGQRPFDGRGRRGARAVLEGEAPWMLLPDGLPSPVVELLHASLARDRLLRPAGFAEVLPWLTIGSPASPDPSTSSGAGVVVHNLPREHSSFVGRAEESRAVMNLMAGSRLVTLTGIGGTGKTRLAIQVARRLGAGGPERTGRAGGVEAVYFVSVEPGASADQLVAALARACGCREAPGTPLADHVIERLAPREVWVMLDGCERAPAASRELASTLLDRAPGVSILCTGRAGLGVPGETIYHVPMLPVPQEGEPARRLGHPMAETRESGPGASDALVLFLDRAGRALTADPAHPLPEPDARRAAAICRRLGGMPLAIEIAAGFVEAASLEELDARLAAGLDVLDTPLDADPQQRTIESVLRWSIDRLDARESAVLRRVAVFSGDFSLAAAEAVASDGGVGEPRGGEAGVAARHVLGALLSLVRRGLIVKSAPPRAAWTGVPATPSTRYRLLDPVRQYVVRAFEADLSRRADADAARARHGAYFLALVERLSPRLDGPDQAACMAALGEDHHEVLAAMDAMTDPERLLRLAVGMARFWYKAGFPSVGRQRLEAAMASAPSEPADARPSLLSIRAQSFLGVLQWAEGRFDEAERHCRRALEMARRAEDFVQVTAISGNIGLVLMQRGDLDGADAALAEALRASERASDRTMGDRVRLHVGVLRVRTGEWAEARSVLGACLTRFREIGDRTREARALSKLGEIDRHEGRLDDAWAKVAGAAEIAMQAGDRPALTEIIEHCAVTAWRMGERRRAGRLASIAGRIRREDGSLPAPEVHEEIARIGREVSISPESAMDDDPAADTLDAIRQEITATRDR